MSREPPQRRTLADIIMEKVQDKKTEIESQRSEQSQMPPMDERLIKVFKRFGNILLFCDVFYSAFQFYSTVRIAITLQYPWFFQCWGNFEQIPFREVTESI